MRKFNGAKIRKVAKAAFLTLKPKSMKKNYSLKYILLYVYSIIIHCENILTKILKKIKSTDGDIVSTNGGVVSIREHYIY